MGGPGGWILSDRGRRGKVAACLALAAGLVAWGVWRGPAATRSFDDVRLHPERYAGQAVAASYEPVVRERDGTVRLPPFVLAGEARASVPEAGGLISFEGELETASRIRVDRLHVHRWQGWRLAVSAVALVVVAVLVARDLWRS